MPKRSLTLDAALIARAHPHPVPADGRGPGCGMALMDEAEADARLDAALAEKPGDPGTLWLFAYGALMWRPEFPFAERRVARLRGWHRRFCLWQPGFRGTPERPGVMLALDRGGQCRGFAYRIAGDGSPGETLREAIQPVWRREMRGRGYASRWLTAETADGPVPVLAFVADRAGARYAGRLSEAGIAARIAAACGPTGPSAEYLLNTVTACEAMGIRDRHLFAMQALVAEALASADQNSPTPTPG
ncbi:gamma-glutamylcyclotransferase [Methylobacterium terricola]|uniref:glutathione-specific gamma-glutamylcyclotransferase n=1 Tax=Methylobacterium terricola TaxID=2583531 RepID=A0A5C4LGA5_9HYPH|nr:gamma-glutamylcyclotransferase [Methylobacterium terricola]TNC12290.1 gamma-glutamylcyclotransferase [Methylobacterium terricola]